LKSREFPNEVTYLPAPTSRFARIRFIAVRVLIVFGIVVLCLAAYVAVMFGIGRARLQRRLGDASILSQNLAINDTTGTAYTYRDNVFTLLVVGVGTNAQRDAENYSIGAGAADTLLLAVLDLDAPSLSLLSIPRDTITDISLCGIDGVPYLTMQDHLVMQYAYGGETAAQCTENTANAVSSTLYDVSIDAWISLDMDVLVDLVDALEGVPIEVPDEETYCAFTGYTPGQWVMLDGEAALQFVQYRDTTAFASSETRIERQKTFLNALLDRLKRVAKQEPWRLVGIYDTVASQMTMNLTFPELVALAILCANISVDEVPMYTLPGEVQSGTFYEEYYINDDAARQLLLQMFYQSAV
jgi:LCP family protein required for cell wall assembly